ncbi:hypothetical protein [Pseudomonas guariconensis]|uniref:hypothetical protein n=1 Tax=Pseudomonas guariconensis TaxID=1288410 RepID=UPI00300C44E4
MTVHHGPWDQSTSPRRNNVIAEKSLPLDVDEELPHPSPMNDSSRSDLNSLLSAIEERMDRRIERMEREADKRAADFKAEVALRDDQIKRELDLRQESFRFEQAARDAALAEKFSGFLSAQAERDKALDKISDARFERLEKDVSSIKADSKKIADEVHGIKVTMAKYLGAAVVIGALASAALGAAAKHLLGS